MLLPVKVFFWLLKLYNEFVFGNHKVTKSVGFSFCTHELVVILSQKPLCSSIEGDSISKCLSGSSDKIFQPGNLISVVKAAGYSSLVILYIEAEVLLIANSIQGWVRSTQGHK